MMVAYLLQKPLDDYVFTTQDIESRATALYEALLSNFRLYFSCPRILE